MRIGLYSPFFGSTLGGGEKYFGMAAEVMRDAYPDAEVEILSPVPVDVARYERMLGLDLHGIAFRSTNASGAGWRSRLSRIRTLRRFRDLVVSRQAAQATARYDLLLNMVYVLPATTRARHSIILCQFPYDLHQRLAGDDGFAGRAPLRRRLVRRLLLGRELDAFDAVIAQSEYTRGWVRRLWSRDAAVVNPPVEVPAEEPDRAAKRPVILSAGRFFVGGHSKRQDLLVEQFRALVEGGGAEGWELHLVGTVQHQDARDTAFLERVRALAQGLPVHIHVDAPHELLHDLYRQASIYWHAAGYGVDARRRPAELEHFGMTTAEAMGHGAVPVVIAAGGQPEVVEDGVSGLLWSTPDELRERTLELIADPDRRAAMGAAARRRSLGFSVAEFRRRLRAAVEPVALRAGARP